MNTSAPRSRAPISSFAARVRAARSKREALRRSPLRMISYAVVVAIVGNVAPAAAAAAGVLPAGFQSDGHATMTSTGNSVSVRVTGPVARINWTGGMNLGAGNSLNFTNGSPGSKALAVNIDTSGNASYLNGAINSNGVDLLFANPHGTYLGPNAAVNVTGTAVFASGTVLPEGQGSAAKGGVSVELNNAPTEVSPNAQMNGGSIPMNIGPGQLVSMTTVGAQATVPSVAGSANIRLESPATTTYTMNNGVMKGDSISIATDATLSVRNSVIAGGSKVVLTGKNVALSGAKITAGAGSEVDIGGGRQGKDASIANAETVSIDAGTTIDTGAKSQVNVWSNQHTEFDGSITNPSGNADVSGRVLHIADTARVDLRGVEGMGNLTLDPDEIRVDATGTGDLSGYGGSGSVTVSTQKVSDLLATSNLTLEANRLIWINGAITGGQGASLTLRTAGLIELTGAAKITLFGDFVAIFNDDAAPAGSMTGLQGGLGTTSFSGPGFVMDGGIYGNHGASISTNGGNVTIGPGAFGGTKVGAVVIYPGASIDTGAGNISITGVGTAGTFAAGVTIGAGLNAGDNTLSTTTGAIHIDGTGLAGADSDGVSLNGSNFSGGNGGVAKTTTGNLTVVGTGGALSADVDPSAFSTGSNGIELGGALATDSGSLTLTGKSTGATGVVIGDGAALTSKTGNISVAGQGAGQLLMNAAAPQSSEHGVFVGASTIQTDGDANFTGDTALMYGSSISARTINVSFDKSVATVGASQTATSINWSGSTVESQQTTFNAANTKLTSTGDMVVNGSTFNGNAQLAAGGEARVGHLTADGKLGTTVGNDLLTTVTGDLGVAGNTVNVSSDLTTHSLDMRSQNSMTLGSMFEFGGRQYITSRNITVNGPTLFLSVDDKNTNTGNFDVNSTLKNYSTVNLATGTQVTLRLAAPTDANGAPLTVSVPAVPRNPLPADNDPNVAHPGYTWTANTVPAPQTGTVQTAQNVLGNLSPYETDAMKQPASKSYYDPATGRTVYTEPDSVLPAAQQYLPGTWVANPTTPTEPPVTPPVVTPPVEPPVVTPPTETPPVGTPPTETPPAQPPVAPPTQTPPVQPPVTPPVNPPASPTALPSVPTVVPPTTIVATPDVDQPGMKGNVLFIPSSTPAQNRAGATLALPQIRIDSSADAQADASDLKR